MRPLKALLPACIALLALPGGAAAGRVLLVGLDGASWNVMEPMLAAGELPNLARLIARGVHADLDTVEPVISPTVWTSIATGRSPEAHGITDFFASGLRRRVPTAFERLAARGRRVGVYDYLVTWPPAALPQGFVIPGWLRRDDRVTPADVWQRVNVPPFVTDYDRPRTNLDYLEQSRAEVREKASRWNALARAFQLEVGAVAFYTPDSRSHRFWRAAFPEQFAEPGPKVAPELETAIADGYRGVDRALGEIVAELEPEDAILIASDHGFQASEGPRNVWVTRTDVLFDAAGLGSDGTGVRVVGEFNAVAVEVDLAFDSAAPLEASTGDASPDSFAGRDRAHRRVAEALRSCRTLRGDALFDVYALDVAARPAGFERGLLERAYQWSVLQVLYYLFGIELDENVHGVVIARPRDGTIEPLWPDAHVRVGESEVAVRSILDRQEFTGTHHPTAILIAAGGPIVHVAERTRASVLDLAPLIFHLAGEAVPEDLEGRVPTDWLTPELLAARPVERRPVTEFPDLPRPSARPDSPGLERELEEKLRGLGYVE
jgi:hypothetical protein